MLILKLKLCRDVDSWKSSVMGFMKTLIEIPQGAILDQEFFHNPHMSKTAHHALHKAVAPYCLYTISNLTETFSEENKFCSDYGPLFLDRDANFEKQEPWPRMIARKYRLFHADITINAPKERTLFNYNIKVHFFSINKTHFD